VVDGAGLVALDPRAEPGEHAGRALG